MNTTTQQDTQAAANKAAEEGGLTSVQVIINEWKGWAFSNRNGDMSRAISQIESAIAFERLSRQDEATTILRDVLLIQEACDLHTDEYAPGSVIEYIKDLEAESASRQVANKAEVEPKPVCSIPPEGWYCTRKPGHEGPCAAVPADDTESFTEAEEAIYQRGIEDGKAIESGMARLRAGAATPPATTGAMPKDLAIQCLNALDVDSEAHAALSKFIIEGGATGASTVLTDEPRNGIAATLRHDEGAIARCSYCRRYSLDPATLSDRQPACDCGKQHGWCGSFQKPEPDSLWSGKAPAAREVAAQAGQVAVPVEQLEWSHDLQERLIAAGQDFDEHESVRQVMAEAACLLAALTGVRAPTSGERQEGGAA